jgi:hypothetical protein
MSFEFTAPARKRRRVNLSGENLSYLTGYWMDGL